VRERSFRGSSQCVSDAIDPSGVAAHVSASREGLEGTRECDPNACIVSISRRARARARSSRSHGPGTWIPASLAVELSLFGSIALSLSRFGSVRSPRGVTRTKCPTS
jgi:hypothetical protein